jgi:ATP-dependent DNA helicase RecG
MQVVEAKRAQREMPSDLLETLSAFSNTADGGVILLGVDQAAGFAVTGVTGVEYVSSRVAQACRDEMEPPLAPLISSDDVDGKHLVIIEVPSFRRRRSPATSKVEAWPTVPSCALAERTGN